MTENSERVKRSFDKKRLFIAAFKAEQGCRVCGESDPDVLDLHHKDPTTKNPKLNPRGRWKNYGGNLARLRWDEIEAELDKCETLCANCHRREEARLRA